MQRHKKLGLDIGEKRIGVAISDMLGMMAHPLKTIHWKGLRKFVAEINEIILKNDVDTVVVGMPYTLKGTYSAKTNEILELVNRLKEHLPVNVETIDERLTTKMAENALHMVGKKTGKSREKIDQIAAVYILQSYLDKV